MLERKSITAIQWIQLCVVTFGHLAADSFGCVFYAVMPAIRDHFSLSLTAGVAIITIFNLGCNAVQLLFGPMRASKKKPFFLYIGVVLASTICLIAFLPQRNYAFYIIALLAFMTSLGVGCVHPEGMRAVHLLRRIRPALSTTFYLNAGYVGYCGANFAVAWLVYMVGLKGLLIMLVLPVIQLAATAKYRIRLAIDRLNNNTGEKLKINFWLLFFMAVPLTATSTIVPAFLPMYLKELGFKLYFGGLAIAIFGLGGMFGGFFWAKIAQFKGEMFCAFSAAMLAWPFLIIYMIFVKYHWAILLLFGAGFNATAAFILLVTLARQIPTANLGLRMGLMIGGVWGVGSIILMLLGPVAERFGIKSVLGCSWVGYFIAAAAGFYILVLAKENSLTPLSNRY